MNKAAKKVRTENSLLIISNNRFLSSLNWEKYLISLNNSGGKYDYCIIDKNPPVSLSKYPLSSSAKIIYISSTAPIADSRFPYQVINPNFARDSTTLPYLVNHLLNPNLYTKIQTGKKKTPRKQNHRYLIFITSIIILLISLLPISLLSSYINFRCRLSFLTAINSSSLKCSLAKTMNHVTKPLLGLRPLSLFHNLSQLTFELDELEHQISQHHNPLPVINQVQARIALLQADLKIFQRHRLFQPSVLNWLILQSADLQQYLSLLSKTVSSLILPADFQIEVVDNFDLTFDGGKPLGKYPVSINSLGSIGHTGRTTGVHQVKLSLFTLYSLIYPHSSSSDFINLYQKHLLSSPLHGAANFAEDLINKLLVEINSNWQERGMEMIFSSLRHLYQKDISTDIINFPSPDCRDFRSCIIDEIKIVRENTSSLKPDLFLNFTKNITVTLEARQINYLVELEFDYHPPYLSWPSGEAAYILKVFYPPDLLLVSTDPAARPSRSFDQLCLTYQYKLVPGTTNKFRLQFTRPNPAPENLKYILYLPRQPFSKTDQTNIAFSYPQNWFVYVSPRPEVASSGLVRYNLGVGKSDFVTLDLILPRP